MKRKIFQIAIVALFFLNAFSVMAAGGSAYEKVQPYYIFLGWGNFELNQMPETDKRWNIQVILDGEFDNGGRLTVAKDILVDAEETITNSINDVGVMDSRIDVVTSTREHYKGLIIKVFPENTKSGVLTLNVNGEKSTFMVEGLDKINKTLAYADGTEFRIKSLQYLPGVNLKDVNKAFYNKLEVYKRVFGMERWARQQLQAGKITTGTFRQLRVLTDRMLGMSFSDEKVREVDVKFLRFAHSLQKGRVAPGLVIPAFSRIFR